MDKYPALRNILASIFSVDVGLSEAEENAVLSRILENDAQRSKIESELNRIFQDESISWSELVENDKYVVYSPDDEDDAKTFIVERIWNRVFRIEDVP